MVTALAFALSSSYAKALTRHAHVFVVTWAMMSLSLLLSLPLLLAQGIPEIGERFLLAALASVILNLVAGTLQVKAVSLSPLSLTIPFLAFTPLFMIATSAIILRELPDTKGVAGILLVVAGTYAINLEKIRGGILEPLRAIATERGSLMMLVVALLWSVTAVLDKVASLASSPSYYTTFFSIAFGILYAPALVVGLRRRPLERGVAARLVVLGLLSAVMIITQFTAIEMTVASYVIAVKRAGMVVSVLLGYFIFKETHLRARLAGAALMMAGVVLISL
jgi:drug/metabolite transporter (DMT)-like permease